MTREIDPFKAEEDFRAKLQEAGLVPPDGIMADGKLHRINVEDEKPGKKSGFYVYHSDGIPAGAFGDWHDGKDAWHTWCACATSDMTPAEAQDLKRRIDAARAARSEAERARRAEAQATAAEIWERAKPCDSHPYLDIKGAKSYGLRDLSGRLVMPIRDRDGQIHSVEFIDAEGAKMFLAGGRKDGCWFGIGPIGTVICVAEGYATGASVHEATGHHVAVAFDCGNMPKVAKQLRELHPTAKIVICADDDPKPDGKNPGAEAAAKAAKEANALIAVPALQAGGDFNDQHAIKGIESVAETIQKAIDSDDAPIEARDLFALVMREIDARKSGKSKSSLKTGIDAVDRMTGGIKRGELTVVAGLPGSGKTAAALGIIVHNASHGVPCLLFSIEMDRIQIGVRILSQNSGIPAFDMLDEHRPLAQADWDAMFSASARMEKISLTLDDRPVSMAQIIDQAHKWYALNVRAAGLETGLIVIDYLGLIQSEGEGENRNREIAKLTQGAKLLARKLRLSVMLCAQLNREAAKRGGEPELSDLRDSGEIEAAGDLIIFPYQWPRYENADHELVMKPPKDGEEAEDKFLVRKNKNGPKGAASVMWHPELMQYTGIERNAPEPPHDTRTNWQDREGN